MTKVLFIKQMREITAFLYISGKKGKRRSKRRRWDMGLFWFMRLDVLGFCVMGCLPCFVLRWCRRRWIGCIFP